MSKYILDASALLALLNAEEGAETVEQYLPESVISTVNLSEVVSRLSAAGMPVDEIREVLSLLALELVPFDEEQAFQAGFLYAQTKQLGISLGDRACLALGQTMGAPVITADQMWSELDVGTIVKLIR